MDKPGGLVGEFIEKGQKTTSNVVSDIADSVSEQVGVAKPTSQQQAAGSSSGQVGQSQQDPNAQGAEVSEATKEIVEDFYAPSDKNPNTLQSSSQNQNPTTDTQDKLARVRQELLQQHTSEYYDPLFAYENKKPEATKADVIEQEDYKKMQELALDQQKKNEDIALVNAKTAVEAHRGAAG